MNPQEILNAQYTAPDMPDVSQVAEAMRTVREHVARNKGPYALLAASLPVIGYGAHRALRKTPEAEVEPSLHAGPATTQSAEIHQGGDKIAEEVMARFGLHKEAFGAQAVGGALGALGGAYAGWQGGKDQNTFDRVLGAGAGAVGGGALGMAAGHGASKLYGRLTAPASVPGAQAMFSAMHGGSGGVHAPPSAAAPRPGVQPPGVRAAPPVGPPRAAPPPHASPDPSTLRASVPAEHQEKFDKIPAHLQQGVADHMGWGTHGTPTGGPIPEVSGQVLSKEQARAAVLGIPPTPPGVQPPGARPKPPVGPPRAVPPPGPQAAQPTISATTQAPAPKGPYYADPEAMLNDGLMSSFHGRARQAWDSGLVPNTSHDWIMAHNLHSLHPEEHASALAEFAPQDWEHKLLTAMGPRQPKVSPSPTA